MYRSVLFAVLLLAPAVPLNAQAVASWRSAMGELRVGQALLQPGNTLAASSSTTRSELVLSPPSRGFMPLRQPARIGCPRRSQAFLTGALVGLVAGGAIGFSLADQLPNPGMGDVPPEAVYVPLFALPAGVAGGLIGGASARCPGD